MKALAFISYQIGTGTATLGREALSLVNPKKVLSVYRQTLVHLAGVEEDSPSAPNACIPAN